MSSAVPTAPTGPVTPVTGGSVAALSVHGSRGVVDLTVPGSATIAQVASAYAASAALPAPPTLVLVSGRSLDPATTLDAEGLSTGAVLVALDREPLLRAIEHARSGARGTTGEGGRLAAGCAAALALLAAVGAVAADHRLVAGVVLAAGAVLGVLPLGRRQVARVVAAPALGAAACTVLAWDPAPARLPTVLGAGALAAAVTAAVGRTLLAPDSGVGDVLRVWVWAGIGWFLLAAGCALTGASTATVWALGLLLAVLAARWVPTVAVDVPDQYLIDLERLAVTAWSARERPPGKRGRVVVPREYVAGVARRGGRTVLAASSAILVVTAVTAPMLMVTADVAVDRVGVRCMVLLAGGTLLLAARGYRHDAARRMLRVAGTGCLLLDGVVLLEGATSHAELMAELTAAVVAGAALLVVVAVALGRGWRSAWWSRRAEILEVVSGAGTVAALVVATGVFRHLWEHSF